MAKHFKNLKILKLDNTSLLEKLKANELIESVSLLNSNILSVNSFKKKVPEPLLTRNNMANYTQVKLNGVLLSESEIAKLKLGKMNVEHNDRIEVMDGVLAGAIFTIILGTPLNELIKDSVLLTHIKELLNKESASSLVSLYELQTITWIGKNPDEVTELNYLGYFNTKTIGNMETFKNDLKQLPNLKYINLAGAIFTTELNLNDFNLTNFKYSFANCTVLQNITIDKTILDLEGTFRNCQNLRTVTIGENANLSNMVKTFYGCKGILNFTINNPNMTDTDNANVFEESLISTLTFTKEPVNNIITSNLLKRAIYSSSTLNLDNKNRPDLYNLTSTTNTNLEKLTLNNTRIEEIDLTKATTNFTNLKYLEANNTNKLQNFKLNGSNLTSISFTNSSILYQKINNDETPRIFIENKDYYSRVSVNGIELTETEVLELKNGTRKFNHADTIEFLNGPLLNISFKITSGITPSIISEVFPDPTLAEYIRLKTNKATINDIVTQDELNSIIYFGYDGLQTSSSDNSWFKGKTVNSWVGTENLKKIQNVYLYGVLGTASEIIISSKEIKTLYYAFSGCKALTSITLPTLMPNLTDLSSAFSSCTGLTTVTLPKRLPKVTLNNYYFTFSGCNLDELYVSLPTSTNGFGYNNSYYFLQNANIKKIIIREPDIGDTDPVNLSYMCTKSTSKSLVIECQGTSNEKITSLKSAFSYCSALTSITLPTELPNLTDLSSAFNGCTGLTSITLPTELPNLTDLSSAFRSCIGLTSITLPTELPNLTNLSYSFQDCSALKSIVLPKRLPKVVTENSTSNGYHTAFSGCNLDELYVSLPTSTNGFGYYYQYQSSNGGHHHYDYFLENANIKKIIIREPDIGNTDPVNLSYMCKNSTSKSLVIECQGTSNEKITSLKSAFSYCSALTSITLPTELPNLTDLTSAFSYCSALTSITLPTELPNLTDLTFTFQSCSALTSITLPAKLPKVTTTLANTYLDLTGRTIIYGSDDTVTRLNDIKYHNATTGVTEYLQSTLDYTNLGNLVLDYPPGQIKQLFPDSTLAEYIRIKLNKNTTSEKITQADLDTITYFGYDGLQTSSSVNSWFKGKTVNSWKGVEHLKNIQNVYLNGVLGTASEIIISSKEIKTLSYAFNGCTGLTSITLPTELPNLTNLSYAFSSCSSLTSITLPTSMPNLTDLSYAFNGCTGLTSITLPTSMPNLTDLSYAFNGCTGLTSITLPTSMPNLTDLSYAFRNCTSLISISLPPILPKLTTSLASTYLEGTNRTYIYHANPEVDDVQKITLHPSIGTKDYSKLTNLLTFGQAFLDDILSQYICSKLSLNTNSPMDSSRLNLIIELTDFPNGITNFEGLKYCKKLEYVSFKNQISYRVINLKHCVNIKRLNDSFSGCTNLQSLELPDILTNATSFENMLLNCNNLTLLTIPNINDYRLIKEIDKSNLTVCFKGEAENIEEIYLLNELIYANLKLSNEHYEKKLSFFFSKNLKEAVKTKLSLQGEDPIVTITQLDSIEDLTINTQYYFDENLGFLVLKNLKVLTIENNSSLRNLNLKFLKSPLAEININNCPNLYSLFLPIYDSFSGEVNINLLDGHKIKEIFANKKINLDYPGIKKNY